MMNKVDNFKSQRGNAVVIVLVVLAVVAVGALAYLSGQITSEDEYATQNNTVAAAEPASGQAENQQAAGDDTVAAEAGAEGTSEQANAETPMKIEPGNPVVAKVGDEEITRLDVLNFITQLPPNIRQLPIEQLFPLAQEQVVNSKIIEMNVDSESVAESEEVQQQIENAREQIIRNAYLEEEVAKRLTDERLQQAYEEQVSSQPDVEEVKASHILVEEEAKAQELIQQLEEGADFAELAKENSTDGTAQNGGDLGYFSKADVVPEFAEAAFDLEEGAYTKEPVQTQFGYHVIKLEEKRMRPKPTFEQAKPTLESSIRREILENVMQEWREKSTVVKYDINGEPVEEGSN
ncbi:MAG: peptidylprolyl isomerase [Alphaproteobacteria bacterium]